MNSRRTAAALIGGLLCAAAFAATASRALAVDGMNYYHESMGYIQRSSAQIDSDLSTIKQKTSRLKVYYNPYNSGNLANCQTIVTKAKAQGFYVVWNENNDNTTFTTANWSDYNNRVVADALTAKNAGADEFLVGNEMSIHNDGSAMFNDTNFPAAIKTLVTNCAANFPGTKGVEEGWWKHDAWAAAGLGSVNKIYFTLYEPPYNFASALANIWSQFGVKAEIGETSTETTKGGLLNDEDDWSRNLMRRYTLEQQTGINYWYFTYKEPSEDGFGLFFTGTGAQHLVWDYIRGVKTFGWSTLVNDNFDNGTTQDFTGGTNVANRLRVDAFSEATAGPISQTDCVFRGTLQLVSSTGAESWRALRPMVRWTDDNNYYFIEMEPNSNWVQLYRRVAGVETGLAGINYTLPLGQDFSFELRVSGSGASTNVKFFLNEKKLIDAVDSANTTLNAGKAGLRNNGIQGDLDNVLITTIETNVTGIPPTPAGLTATAGNTQVALSWNASSGATSYNLKRGTVSGSGYATVASPTTTSYTNTGLTNGTTYYYVVSAVNSLGESANSAQASATPQVVVPQPPANLAATPGNAQIALSWTASTGATTYNVKRSTASGSGYLTIASPATTSYTNTGLTNGTTYFYVVTATNSAGTSGNSPEVSGTPAAPPSTPTGLSATAGNTQVSLSWNAASGATSYNVKRSTVSGSGYATIVNLTTTSYVNSGLTNGTTYYYVVSAVNSGGESANSSQVSATPQPAVNIALNKAATASSLESGSYPASNAVDGNSGTRWSSGQWLVTPASAIGWIYVDLGASYNISEVKLNWEAAYGADYQIQTSANASAWTTIKTVTGNTSSGWLDYTGLAGTGRYVRIYCTRTSSINNYSLWDFEVYGTSAGSPPPAPGGLTATGGSGQVALAWSASSGAASYNVKRSTVSGSGYTQVANVATTSYTNTGLTNGTTYYLVVTALNSAGESGNSNQASATPVGPPPNPTGLAATPASGQVALTWNASTGATAYDVKRSTVSGSGYVTVASPASNSYTNTGLTNGTTYYFVVDAKNANGTSANSSQVSATPSALVINYGSGFTSTGLQINGNAALNGTKLRLTNGTTGQTSSAFYTTKVNVASFTTHFSFQDTSATGDGMTFCLQNNAATTIGGGGQDLGYYGIANSICVKFDLYSNAGEGVNSTGLYTNGALPTVPSTDLTGTGIDLHSGHVFNVTVTYNGTTLSVTEQDATTLATATQNYTINIPTTIGASTAYAGFTAATGGVTAIQDILTWTW